MKDKPCPMCGCNSTHLSESIFVVNKENERADNWHVRDFGPWYCVLTEEYHQTKELAEAGAREWIEFRLKQEKST